MQHEAEEAWQRDVKLRRYAAQAGELWAFVCSEAGDDEGRRDELLRQLFRMTARSRSRRAASIRMTIEAKPGYVRCELAFPIRGYQLLEHPDAPALRVLAIETDDGPVALLMNKEIAETVGQALLRIAEQMLEKDDLS